MTRPCLKKKKKKKKKRKEKESWNGGWYSGSNGRVPA
jgi:hypothetical protein